MDYDGCEIYDWIDCLSSKPVDLEIILKNVRLKNRWAKREWRKSNGGWFVSARRVEAPSRRIARCITIVNARSVT